jgi:hypothetical protein
MKRSAAEAAVVLLVSALLAGCAPSVPVDGTATPTAHPTRTASAAPTDAAASATPEPETAASFTPPATCSALAGPELEAIFAERGIELFNSSNGEGLFAGEPVNTHQQGGNPFGCLWGVQNADLNTFVLSAQKLSNQAHEGVLSILDGSGYEKTVTGDVVTYTEVGSETGGELTIHVLRPDSWMTGWGALGGEAARTRITEYLDAAAANLYS